MRGRKPDTAGQQAGKGDTRKIGAKKLREKMASHPEPIRGLPKAPDYLGPIAQQKYSEWATQLASMGQDYQCDGPMLEAAAMAYEQAVKAYQVLTEKGQTVEIYKEVGADEDGKGGDMFCVGIKVRPEVGIWSKCSALVRSFCSEMGLSLVSRTRLTIEKQDDSDAELMDLLSKPRAPRTIQVQ